MTYCSVHLAKIKNFQLIPESMKKKFIYVEENHEKKINKTLWYDAYCSAIVHSVYSAIKNIRRKVKTTRRNLYTRAMVPW